MSGIPPWFIRKYGWVHFSYRWTIVVLVFFQHFSAYWAFNYSYFVNRMFWLFTLFTCYSPNVSFKSYEGWDQFYLICKDFLFCPCVESPWSVFTRLHLLRYSFLY